MNIAAGPAVFPPRAGIAQTRNAFDLGDRAKDLLTALFHIVIGADANGGNLALRPDHMLKGGNELRC